MATASVYLYHLDSSPLGYYRIDPFAHPGVVTKLFFFSLGNVAGKQLPIASLIVPTHGDVLLGIANPWIIAFGVVIFACEIVAIANTISFGSRHGTGPLGVALIVFSFGFDGLTAIGRGLYGYSAVGHRLDIRPTTFYTLVGAYLVVINRPSVDCRTLDPADKGLESRGRPGRYQMLQKIAAVSGRVLPTLVVACVVIQVVFGYHNGLSIGRDRYVSAIRATSIIRHYQNHLGAHDNSLFLVTYASTPEAVRLIELAERDRLSLLNSR